MLRDAAPLTLPGGQCPCTGDICVSVLVGSQGCGFLRELSMRVLALRIGYALVHPRVRHVRWHGPPHYGSQMIVSRTGRCTLYAGGCGGSLRLVATGSASVSGVRSTIAALGRCHLELKSKHRQVDFIVGEN